jgi:hypothetical protein
MRDLLSLSARVSEMGPFLTTLIGQHATSLAADGLEQAGPRLAANRNLRTPFRTIIATLLNDEGAREALVRGLAVERGFHIEGMTRVTGGASGAAALHPSAGTLGKAWHLLFLPYLQLDAAEALHRSTQTVQAAREPNWPAARSLLPSSVAKLREAGPLTALIPPKLDGSIEQSYRGMARRRLTAVALAFWEYQADTGTSPSSLDELVPACLERIPSDPLAAGNTTVQYIRDAGGIRLRCGQSGDTKHLPITLTLLPHSSTAPATTPDG